MSVQIFVNDCTNIQLSKYSTIQNGDEFVVFGDYNLYKQLKSINSKIRGVTFIFDGNFEFFSEIIKELNINIAEKSKTSFVGYTNYFDSCVNYDNKKVNIQGYFNGEKIYIGIPLILGSY
ncbi:MAG: hypothetical protein J6Q51_00070 [Clostridia bacterium]|nr:hypothetical protein [Clostridia bacterium]